MYKFLKILLLFVFTITSINFYANNSEYASDVFENESRTSFPLDFLIFKQDIDRSKFSKDSIAFYKEQSILSANNNDAINAVYYGEKYIQYSGETHFVEYGHFKSINKSKEFILFEDKYAINYSFLNFFYLFCSLIGFFIVFVLLFKRKQDKVSARIITIFVLTHSLFIFHIFLYQSKLIYEVPHVVYTTSIFSFLYGPLFYFYYKRITSNYRLKKIDLFHLLPTFIVIIMMLPIFLLPAAEKINVMLNVGIVDRVTYRHIVVSAKILSLFIYGLLVIINYFKNRNSWLISEEAKNWIRNLVILTNIYVVSYLIYAFALVNLVPRFDFLFNLQIIAMGIMVLYIGYSSFQKSDLFTSEFTIRKDKYAKSGLTPSFSLDLKNQLLILLEEEKLYRQNDINLALVSEKLGTTRHNTSQVINEHFGLNFFELINKYRIQEALKILKGDKKRDLNIIDIAYEVGFNNKVTFNKSFKKQLSQTPSQYLLSLR